MRHCARQRDRPVEPRPGFLQQREGRLRAGMAAGAGGDQHQPIRALFDRLVGEGLVDHVMDDVAAVGMDGVVHLRPRAEAADDQRDLVLHAQREVLFQPVIGPMHDEVDRVGRRRPLRMRGIMGGETFLDFAQPFVELFNRPRIQRWHGADHAGGALRDHQVGD